MNTENGTTEILKIAYYKFQPIQPLIDRLLRTGIRSATVLRGRLTPQAAWYELKITGTPEAVAGALRDGRKGADRCVRLEPSVA